MSAVKVIGGGTEVLCSYDEDKVFNKAAPILAVITIEGLAGAMGCSLGAVEG